MKDIEHHEIKCKTLIPYSKKAIEEWLKFNNDIDVKKEIYKYNQKGLQAIAFDKSGISDSKIKAIRNHYLVEEIISSEGIDGIIVLW